MSIKIHLAALAAIMTLGVAGCKSTAEGVAEDTKNNTEAVGKAAEKAGDTIEAGAKEVGHEIKDEAQDAQKAINNATEPVREGVNNADITFNVQTALSNASDLKDANIDVDTDSDAKTITLKGTVASEDAKKKATTLAQAAAPKDFKVTNNLTVGTGG